MKKEFLLLISILFVLLGIKAQAQITVTGIKLLSPPDSLYIGDEVTIRASIQPVNAANKEVTWITSDPTVIQIVSFSDSTCHLKSVAAGLDSVTITVSTKEGQFTDTKTIITDFPPVQKVTLNEHKLNLQLEDKFILKATVEPELAVNKNIIWESNDRNIAIVYQDGEVLARNVGTTLIIAIAEDSGVKDTCVVTVNERTISVSNVSLDKNNITLAEGYSIQLNATITPGGADNKNVTWSCEDITVAEVSANGLVTAKKTGDTKVWVLTQDGGFKDSCIITVKEKIITLDTSAVHLNNGTIGLFIEMPAETALKGSFIVHLPKGFALDVNKTRLTDEFSSNCKLDITGSNVNQWKIKIIPDTTSSRLLANDISTKVLDIAYTTDNSVTNGVYDIMLSAVDLKLSNETVIKESFLNSQITVSIVNQNEIIENVETKAYIANGCLFVNSSQAETIYIYSISGKLLFAKNKVEGEEAFDLQTAEPVLIIKGSSGWSQKIAK